MRAAPSVSRTLLKARFWTCVHVTFFLVLTFLLSRGDYEERLYRALVLKVSQPAQSRQQLAVALTHKIHELVAPRSEIWGRPLGGPYESVFCSISGELNAPHGACGSYAAILLKTLKTAGFPVRYVQMHTSDGIDGGHILVEAEIEPGRWAVLDAMFDVSLIRPDGRLASFEDVHANYDSYARQLPSNWGTTFRFEDVRYTNWEKIPILMPLLHRILSWVLPAESLRTISLRAWVTNLFYLYAACWIAGYIGLLLSRRLWRHYWTRRSLVPDKLYDSLPVEKGSEVPA